MAKTTICPSELNCGIPRYGELAGSDHERDDEGFWCKWDDVWPVLMAYDARSAAEQRVLDAMAGVGLGDLRGRCKGNYPLRRACEAELARREGK